MIYADIKKPALTSGPAFIAVCMFIVTLKMFYIFYVNPQESYRGYSYINHGSLKEIVSFLVCLIPMVIMPYDIKKPSDISILILFTFIYVPSVSIGGYLIEDVVNTAYFYLTLLISVISLKIFADFFTKYISLEYKLYFPNQIDFKIINIIILGLFLFSLFSLSQSWSNFFNIQTMADLYTQRLEGRVNQGSFNGYLYSVIKSLVIVIAVYKFLQANKLYWKFLAAFCIFVICLDLLMSQFIRSHLYVAFFLVVIGFLIKNNSLNFYYFPLICLLICFTCFLIDYLFKIDFFSHTFPRRLFIVPGAISAFYFNYVIETGLFYKLEYGSRFFDFGNVTYIIGTSVQSHQFDMNMSTNLWSISYAYIGILGILLTSFFAGLFLSILNSYKYNSFLASIMAIFFGLIWSEQSLWSSMLSSGIIFCLIYFYIYSNSNSNNWKRL